MNQMLNILIRRSLRAGRTRNLIAVLAITLTAVLFTTVTTLWTGAAESMTLTLQLQKGSRSDGDFRNMTKEQFHMLKGADFIKEYGLRMPVGFLTNTVRHNIEFDVMDETEAELMFCTPTHGNFPASADEVVTSDAAIRELGCEPEIGARIPVAFTAHGKEYNLTMTVSGWYEASNSQLSMMAAGTSFADARPDIFTYTWDKDRDQAGTYWSDIIAAGTSRLNQKADKLIKDMGGIPDDMTADNYLPFILNTATNQPVSPATLIMGGCVVLLFVFCGYLLIYNVFDIAVMQEIRRYGLYRTIGMSKRQVRMVINRQAFLLSAIGIPLGLTTGYLIGNAALPVVMDILSGEYKNIAAGASPSASIFLGAGFLTAATVFLSTRKPVKAAADIPPIEAFRYVEAAPKAKCAGNGPRFSRPRKRTPHAGIARLAWTNLGRNKRRTAFIFLSLALCIVLLNSAGIAAASLDVEKQVDYVIRTDFAVVNAASANGQKGFTLREQGLPQRVIDAINERPGVTDASAIYKNTLEDTNVTYDFGADISETYEDENYGIRRGITKNQFFYGLGSDGHPLCNVYGVDETALSRLDIQEGETNARLLYEKMKKGEGILAGVPAERTTMTIDPVLDQIQIGDRITVRKNGKEIMKLPVLSKAALNGDDQEIGYTANGPYAVGGDGLFLYMPQELYKSIYDKPSIYKYAFDVKESQRQNMNAFLETAISFDWNSLDYMSADAARESSEKTRTMIQFIGGLIGGIFGIAGIINLINTLVTTLLTRRHEFATMQSIGMTAQQLKKMMMWEGIFYAAGGCIIGSVFSAIVGCSLIRELLGSQWYFSFRFTLIPSAAVCAALLILGGLIPTAALKIFYKGSIIEKLRVSE
ncbi:MAG: ABC transporter permease [Dorea sp.]|nr:ABC transporter permease [Dorea sp.]